MSPDSGRAGDARIRLLIVDDSPTVRGIIKAMVGEDAEIAVVGEAADGRDAVEKVRLLRPDVVLMDIGMPGMDGREATARIMSAQAVPIIAFSSLTRTEETRDSIDMLAAGAVDVMGKPDLGSEASLAECAKTLRRKIRIASGVPVVRNLAGRLLRRDAEAGGAVPFGPDRRYAVVGIGASAGGPSALRSLLGRLPKDFAVPVLVVQHMTPGFSEGFVEWLRAGTRLHVRLARAGDRAEPGVVSVAPDGRHLEILPDSAISTAKDRPLGSHVPSVDALFLSMASSFAERGIGILLTGMGSDGVEGLLEIRKAGGLTLAQDEGSAAVFGMPGEAVRRGAAVRAMPPEGIAALLLQIASLPPSTGRAAP